MNFTYPLRRETASVHLEVNPEGCRCRPECEMPCHDRVGIAAACQACGCPSFPEDDA